MVPDPVRNEFRSPLVVAIVLAIAAIGIVGLVLGHPLAVLPVISTVISLYVLYLVIRLVLAVEAIAYDGE